MQLELEFIIEGKAKPKQSFRYTRAGIKYTPKDVKQYAKDIQYSFYAQYPKWLPSMLYEKPLRAKIEVYKSIPKSFSKTLKMKAIAGELRPLTRGDCDNYSKGILDALNGIVYPDDRQIVELSVYKYYSEKEFVKVKIEVI